MGEFFRVFPPERTTLELGPALYKRLPDIRTFFSQVLLVTDDASHLLHVSMRTVPDHPFASQAFTPFSPEGGYHVTADDFDPGLREQKLNSPPYLNAAVMPDALSTLRFSVERDNEHELSEEPPLDLEDTLHLQVFANELRFESRGFGERRRVYSREFYPFDFGPLAVPDPLFWAEGLLIALPAEPAQLAQIEARFVLPHLNVY